MLLHVLSVHISRIFYIFTHITLTCLGFNLIIAHYYANFPSLSIKYCACECYVFHSECQFPRKLLLLFLWLFPSSGVAAMVVDHLFPVSITNCWGRFAKVTMRGLVIQKRTHRSAHTSRKGSLWHCVNKIDISQNCPFCSMTAIQWI